MRHVKLKKSITALLVVSILISMSPTVFAVSNYENPTSNYQDFYVEDFGGRNIFFQRTNSKNIVIITNETEHIVLISIKYSGQSDVIYQWVINDYPVKEFSPDDFDFWNDVILYAEENIDKATLVEFTTEEINENDSMPFSSAGADLAEDLENIVGQPYSDKYLYSKRMDGHDYKLHQSMEFYITKDGKRSWNPGTTIASILLDIIGVTATSINISILCTILGIGISELDTIIPAGSFNYYSCLVMYTRYVTVDNDDRQYSYAYRFMHFDGEEEASLNSRGRACIFPETKMIYYSGNQTEEYFYGGLFDEAYKVYNKLW